MRAFLLERPTGNLIIYDAPGLAAAAGEIQARGGATRQLINHAHEAMFGSQGLDVGVFVGECDRNHTRPLQIAGTFSERQTLDDDLEVIPTPGHTPGTTTFLWDSGSHRFLFTGDTLWIEHGNWRATVLGESDRAAYLHSLALLRELEFDVLVPWAATAGEPYIDVVSHTQAQQRLDAIIERVQAGEERA
ncbi:MAG: MBL fold metallo-hydrolase [Solirubrobacterales bacterium]|nr:MBL fold metallo-hydrolase [Solirubrobacterales bacterium]